MCPRCSCSSVTTANVCRNRSGHDHLRGAGHLPPEATPKLEHLKGHSYFLFDPIHLDAAYRDNAFLVGDSLGLAHPITAEGILPATASGRRCAEAILAGEPASYPARLRRDPVLADYRRVHAAMGAVRKLRDRIPAFAGRSRDAADAPGATSPPADASHAPAGPTASATLRRPSSGKSLGAALTHATIARGFAWMFSGAKLPAPRILDFVLGNGE